MNYIKPQNAVLTFTANCSIIVVQKQKIRDAFPRAKGEVAVAGYNEVKTRKYTAAEIVALTERAARDSGEEWVSMDSIAAYNKRIGARRRGPVRILAFLFLDRPLIGFILTLAVFVGISIPIALALSEYALFVIIAGALLGVYIGSHCFTRALSGCHFCARPKGCRVVFVYPLEHSDTIERVKLNGRQVTLSVRDQTDLVVMECHRCKGRKIEVARKITERVVD